MEGGVPASLGFWVLYFFFGLPSFFIDFGACLLLAFERLGIMFSTST
jgi:hypothetical protein